jgi:hypothetical protein
MWATEFFYERRASNFDHTASLRSATLGDRNLFEFRAAVGRGNMLSPRFLRMQADKCLRSALATADLHSAADLRKMARDLEGWANDAEFEIQRVRRRPLLESSIALN